MAFGTKNSEAVGSASRGVGGGIGGSGSRSSGGGGAGSGGGGAGSGGGLFGGLFGGSSGSLRGRDGLTASQRAKGQNLGLTTGKTWHGNTAFGPAGGFATGYGTRSFGNAKNAQSQGGVSRWSNFNNPNGSPMFGNVGNMGVTARNTGQALGLMNALNRVMANRERGATATAGGLTSRAGEDAVQQGPLPPRVQLTKEMIPGLFQQKPEYNFYDALRSSVPPGTMAFGPFSPAAQPTVMAPFNGSMDRMGYAMGQSYNRNPGQYGPSNTSFYNSPRLGTPSMTGGLANYAGQPSGGGFFSGGLGSRPAGYGGSWSSPFR